MGVVIIGMLVIMTLYRKKHVAYKALVSKANEWVQENETTLTPDSQETEKDENQSATDEDKRIMVLVENEMILRHVYREAGLTAESLAEHLGIHRNQLSRAINKITGENFNHYINSLRIKDAVRLISVATHKDLYINELYERVGFTNRSTFYRIFKQFTGLSPIEFLKNNNKNTS